VRRVRKLRMLALVALLPCLAALIWSPATAQSDQGPRLRVINAMYQTVPVDVLVNDTPLVEALAIGAASDYLAVPEGEIQLAILLAGGDALAEEAIELESGADHSLVLLGDADAFDFVIQTDDTSPPPAGTAKLAFVNANFDGVDLSLLLADGELLVEGLPYAAASDYVELPPGDYDLVAQVLDDESEFATVSGATLADRTTYTVVAHGVPGEGELLVLEDLPRSGPPTPTPGSPTAAATSTAAAGASPTAGTGTPAATIAASASVTATHTVVPALPDTGLGGTLGADDNGAGALSLGLVLLAAVAALLGIRLLRGRLTRD